MILVTTHSHLNPKLASARLGLVLESCSEKFREKSLIGLKKSQEISQILCCKNFQEISCKVVYLILATLKRGTTLKCDNTSSVCGNKFCLNFQNL